ncbi:MAG TPA: multicopper oxidase domain-containing protein [Puia sp.]|nr:multicopper oxidase domain-containing protein [Puia sp.]
MNLLFWGLLALSPPHEPFRIVVGHTIVYHLYISDTLVNYTGKRRHAIAVNGRLPGPTLEFTEGDTAEIHIHNEMMMETSVHWHGIIVPNQYDGVAYLTAPPIGPMETYVAKFPIVQNGTYWYHSHTMLQEQIGLYGAFIIHKRPGGGGLAGRSSGDGGSAERSSRAAGADTAAGGNPEGGGAAAVADVGAGPAEGLPEEVVLFSDWTNEKPYEVSRSLHYATDWYAIRKHSTQDYAAAIKAGRFHTKLTNEWKRMLPMDVSDVAYDLFTVNGRREEERPAYKPGDRVHLRIINGASSSYFWLQYAGGKISVIASDGQDVVPVDVDRLIVGPSETYDLIVTIPDSGSFQFRATAEDRSGSVSFWLGSGEKKRLPALPPLQYFEGMAMMNEMMKGNGEMKPMNMHMSNQTMDMNSAMYPEAGGGSGSASSGSDSAMAGMSGGSIVTLNYGMLRSPTRTTLPAAPTRELRFNLTGNMNRYVWSINNKTVSETDEILIHRGENIRIILYNGTMMRHPMHLHGHFFRLLNGQGDHAPLKEVVDILPMETDTLEFAATESGDWFFHCHILYHMMSGMGRIFHYEGSPPNPGVPDLKAALRHVYSDDREIRPMAKVGLESNGSDGEAMLANTRYRFQTEWRLGTDSRKGYESESHLGRYLGQMQYWLPYIGWDFRYRSTHESEKNLFGQMDTKDHRNVLCAGIQYTLPLLLVADARIDTKGNLRLQVGREDIAVTRRLRFTFMVDTDKEYMAGFRYIVTKYFGFSTHYDSDMGFGAGITLSY